MMIIRMTAEDITYMQRRLVLSRMFPGEVTGMLHRLAAPPPTTNVIHQCELTPGKYGGNKAQAALAMAEGLKAKIERELMTRTWEVPDGAPHV